MESFEVIHKIKINRYHIHIFRYGIVTILKLLEECESKEMFEECEAIYEAILEQNIWANANLPTTLRGIDFKETVNKMFAELGLKPKYYWRNYPFYIEEIKQNIITIGKQKTFELK